MLRIAIRSIPLLAVLAGTVLAGPVIYEPFADSEPTLTGNTPGAGLSSWSGSTGYTVSSSNLVWGILVVEENSVVANGVVSMTGNLAGDLAASGLLDHGTSVWFSMIINTPASGGTNPDTGFAIGTATVSSGNNIPMSGDGFGWSIKQNSLSASAWDGGDGSTTVQRGTGSSAPNNTPILIVGELIWGADSNAVDRLNLYRPDAELEIGSIQGTVTETLDQSTFNKISFGMKSNTSFEFDEIRFGATYDDVAVLPPPKGTVISLY